MSDLQNLTPANTYKGLLQVGDYTNGVDSTVRSVLDGEGTASALAISTTKVGIGTTSPTQELDVNGDIASTTLTASGAVTAGSVSTSGAVGAGSIDVSGNVVADEYALDQTGSSSSAVAIHAPTTNELAIRTNSTERVRIDSDGNCGIGTTNPSAPLEISSNLNTTSVGDSILTVRNTRSATGTGSATIGFVTDEVDGSTADKRAQISASYDGTNGGKLVFSTHNETSLSQALTIESNGNCGIGVTDPSAKLEVVETSSGVQLEVRGTSSVGGQFQVANAGNDIYANLRAAGSSDDAIKLDTNGPSFLNGGNVGIGTETPSAPLEISSTTGGLIMPRMNTSQRNAISSPTPGEMVYDTDLDKFYGRTAFGWVALH